MRRFRPMPTLLAIGALLGLLLGVLGGGGSIVTVPALVYGAGLPPKQAIAASLLVVGLTSAVGAWRQWRLGLVDPRRAFGFAAATMLGAAVGGLASAHVRGDVQLVLLATLMLAAAVRMLRPEGRDPAPPSGLPAGIPVGPLGPPTAVPAPDAPPRATVLLASGLGVGTLTGLVGIGGGFLIVPALVTFARLPMRPAIGTSLFVIACTSATAFATVARATPVPWREAAVVGTMGIAGVLWGAAIGRRLPVALLRRGFGLFLLLLAGFILWTNRGTLRPAAPARTSLAR